MYRAGRWLSAVILVQTEMLYCCVKITGKPANHSFWINVAGFLHSCTCVFPDGSVVFLPLSAAALRELLQFGVEMFLSTEIQRSRLEWFWVCWMVLSGPTAWSSRMCCSRLSSVFLRSRWVLSPPTAIRASAGTVHSEYIANAGFRQRSSTWCFAEPLSCLLLVATCSVSLGRLCS